MKKLTLVVTSILLLLVLVGCGTFSYNIRNYVDIPDYSTISIKQTDIDKQVASSRSSLLSSYKGQYDITEGVIKDGNTAYIYYAGTAIVYNDLFTIKQGEDSFKGIDEALKDVEFQDGKATVTFKLAKDFTFPEEIASALKLKTDKVEAESKSTETPATETETATSETATPATETATASETDDVAEYNPAVIAYDDETADATVTATETPAPETSTEDKTTESATPTDPYKVYNEFFAEKEITIELTVDGKNGKVEEGETLAATMRITHVFDGGTYNEETKAEQNKGEDDRKGTALEIGSKSFIDGFEDGLIGLSVEKGTKVSLDLTFPAPYSKNPALAGMDVVFDVEIQSVVQFYERDLSDAEQFAALKVDYEAANGEGSFDYADEAAYTAGVTKNVKASLAATALVNASKVKDWKYADLEEYKTAARNNLINTYFYYYYSFTGSMPSSEDQIINYFFSGDSTKYLQKIANDAGKSLKNDWVLYQLAKDKGLDTVTKEEYNKFIKDQLAAANVGVTDKKDLMSEATLVENAGGKDVIEKYIVLDKAQNWLGENTKVV